MKKVMMQLSVIIVGVMILTCTAFAEWMFAHGNVAVIQRPDQCSYWNLGSGLALAQYPGQYNFIHMPVPTKYGGTWGARYIRLKIRTLSADAVVSEVHVYNGDLLKKSFFNLNLSDGWQDFRLDLGKKMTFSRGLGISIRIDAGVMNMDHSFIFSAAGAYFTE
jgi:hypothetical protein